MNNQQIKKDEAAQVGIGTMIVFIATILVAAVAAGVLIDTSQKLQDKSTRTGSDAINNVGTAFTVLNVWGDDSTTSDQLLDEIYIDIQLSAGAAPVDLKTLSITYNDGGALLAYTSGPALLGAETNNDEFWVAKAVRDADGSIAAGGVINKDDVVRIGLGQNTDPAANGYGLGELGTDMALTISLTTASGTPISVSFTTPSHIKADAYLRLF